MLLLCSWCFYGGAVRVAVTLTQCWHGVPGGTATAAVHLVEALRMLDEVELIGIGPVGLRRPAAAFDPPIPIKRLHLPYQLLYEAWHRGFEAPEWVSGPVDLVHATAPMSPPVRKVPLVATLHDLFPVLEPANLTPRGVRMMTRAFELMRRDATLVMCSSQQTLDDCTAGGFDPERLRLVPLGATPATVDSADRHRVGLSYQLDKPYLLWVGTAEPRKNLPTLIEAYRRAAPANLELLLVGPDGWGPEVASLFGPNDGIRHLGFVPPEDLPVLLDGAEALVFPSRREGFGLPAIEAMAQGTPVVGAIGTAVAEVVGDTGLLLDPSVAGDWAEAIRRIDDEPDWKHERGDAARSRSEQFTWKRTAELTVAVYREAIEMGSR